METTRKDYNMMEEVNHLLKSGIDIEARWREIHKEEIDNVKKVLQFCKEISCEKGKKIKG